MPGEIFVAKEGACISTPGGELYIVQGKTTVRAGHPVQKAYPHLWEPIKVDFEVEQAPPPADDDEEEEERQPRKTAADDAALKSTSARTQGARSRA